MGPGHDGDAADAEALRAAPLCVVLVSWRGLADRRRRAAGAAAIEPVQQDPVGRRIVRVLLDGATDEQLRGTLGLSLVARLRVDPSVADSMATAVAGLDNLARRLGGQNRRRPHNSFWNELWGRGRRERPSPVPPGAGESASRAGSLAGWRATASKRLLESGAVAGG